MSWASRRKILIGVTLSLVVLTALVLTVIAFVYEAPSCSDGKQNDDERGVDCGGASCSYLCSADVDGATVRFARILRPQAGRVDVIAYVDNKDARAAAHGVTALVELYDDAQVLLGTKTVVIDIPEGTTVPVYLADVYRGQGEVSQVFVSLDTTTLKWFSPTRTYEAPTVRTVEIGETELPRIRATLYNDSAFPLYNITPVATVFDAEGNAIAASKTIVTQMGGQSSATVLFTWNEPFSSPPARIEVLPVTPLHLP
jgi:hypothetical protein